VLTLLGVSSPVPAGHRQINALRSRNFGLASRLASFGRFLGDIDPELASLAGLDRRRHIEPFITSLVDARNTVTGEPISVADRARRIHAVSNFLAEITEWGWQEAPARRLVFSLRPATATPAAAALPARRCRSPADRRPDRLTEPVGR
jgi:hypothetical protein